jgi:hypothetical protein
MLLSILIPTLESRRTRFERISATLRGQIRACGWDDRIEIVAFADAGELPTGTKRNALMQRARGEFIVGVDDDDDVSDRYVELIGGALLAHPDVDCLGIRGEVTYRGKYRRAFVYSAAHRTYQTVNGVYLRPPHHLNPVRRAIALRYPFLDVRRSEDAEWALRIARDGALQREHFIDHLLYRYYSRRWWFAQWTIDRTERIRHPLGLQLVNRLRWMPPRRHLASPPHDVARGVEHDGTESRRRR